ncbi:hypothetical protein HK103_004071 [Boothiomyces macroporosus]|uniref:Chitin-binding type-1 domain-containing protein n=1 Tax=Boothiomyces macroporosus TaxID=261099 RepID=A0AAD5Y8S3_9FUNG|nr:hypothetical protein HK103_004071 [Boothiomyces macroporosus]
MLSLLVSLVTASAITLQCGPGSIDPSDLTTGRVCKAGNCCNSNGRCGFGDGFCSTDVGCQLGFGQCYLSSEVVPPTCGPDAGNRICHAGAPCVNGYCGKVVPADSAMSPMCGANGGGFKCQNGSCCSVNGQCGISPEHCDGRKGCQSLFSNCTYSI